MQRYELMLLIWSSNHSESAAKSVFSDVCKEIESHWWNVGYSDYWWKRKIAYRIKQNDEWYYQVLVFEYWKDQVLALENYLNINNDVIRFLITKVDEDYKPFSKVELEEAERVRYKELKERKLKRNRSEWNKWDHEIDKSGKWEISNEIVNESIPGSWIKIDDLETKIDDLVKEI